MKYLTPLYLSMMYAFVDCSREKLKNIPKYGMSDIGIYQEYRTLNLNGGRQTGKSTAVNQFVNEWISEGNDVVYIVNNYNSIKKTKRNINAKEDDSGKVLFTTLRTFLSDSGSYPFRGQSMKNCLVVVDEPCTKLPELYKLYKAYEDNIKPCTMHMDKETEHPLFFVLGIQ